MLLYYHAYMRKRGASGNRCSDRDHLQLIDCLHDVQIFYDEVLQ